VREVNKTHYVLVLASLDAFWKWKEVKELF
jgi:hypothetical protein